jgi:hypothetical protein
MRANKGRASLPAADGEAPPLPPAPPRAPAQRLTPPLARPLPFSPGPQVTLPPTVPATLAYMHETGVYLLSNGALLIVWLGRAADPGLVAQVGGRRGR